MSFLPYSAGTGVEHSEIVPVIIANSITIAVGELVNINSSGFATNPSTQQKLLGVCIGFAKSDGTPINPAAYVAGTATGTDVTSVAASSTNQTGNQYVVLVETSISKKWSAQVNGTVGTTNASGKIGALIDVDSAHTNYDRVLESTATRTYGSTDHLFVWKTDPADSTRLIVSIASSEYIN